MERPESIARVVDKLWKYYCLGSMEEEAAGDMLINPEIKDEEYMKLTCLMVCLSDLGKVRGLTPHFKIDDKNDKVTIDVDGNLDKMTYVVDFISTSHAQYVSRSEFNRILSKNV